MKKYESYMKKCIKLAKKAEGKTSPNPLVGCVILDKNEKLLSTGYHQKYGDSHAEVNALKQMKDNEAEGGTLIVNLEPCSHHGKTPPCADLIIERKLKTVVIGMKDPNPLVAGQGIEKLKNAGIEVIENVLNKEALELNAAFIKNMNKKSPFIAIKTATTLDGKIATQSGSSKWITSEPARKEVQKIRNRYDAILTTSSTIIQDDPSMNCRLKNGKNPIKIILDRTLKTDFNSKIYTSTGEKIFVVVDEKIEAEKLLAVPKNITIIKCPVENSKLDLLVLFDKLFKLHIMSVLVEAGGQLNGEIISLNLADKIYQFIAPKVLGDKTGINAFEGRTIDKINEAISFEVQEVQRFGPDILIEYKKLERL